MAGAIVQTGYNVDDSGASATTISVTLTGVTAGSTLVAHVGCSEVGESISVSDGSAFTAGGSKILDSGNNQSGQVFYRENVGAGSHTIVATFSITTSSRRLRVAEISGLATSSSLDQSTGQAQASPGTASNGVSSGNTAATTNANDFIVGFSQNTGQADPGTGTLTAGTGFTISGSNLIMAIEGKSVAATGAQAATFTQSVNNARITHVIAFKEAAGGPTTYTKNISDTTTSADSVSKSAFRNRLESENWAVAEALTKIIWRGRNINESLTVAEALTKFTRVTRSISEALTLADTLTKVLVGGGVINTKTISESMVLVEQLTKSVYRNRANLETVVMSDVGSDVILRNRIQNEVLTIVDTLVGLRVKVRSILESIIVDNPGVQSYDVILAANLITVIDQLTAVYVATSSVISRTITETIIMSENAFLRAISILAVEPLDITDTGFRKDTIARLVSLVDFNERFISALKAKIQNKFIRDTITMSEDPTFKEVISNLLDGFDQVDALYSERDLNRYVTETISIIDALTKVITGGGGPVINTKSISESAAFADQVIDSIFRNRAIPENIAFVEQLLKAQWLNRAFTDNLAPSDQFTPIRLRNRQLSDAMLVSDQSISQRLLARALNENMAIVDQLQQVRQFNRKLSESLSIADVLTYYKTGLTVRVLAESIAISDVNLFYSMKRRLISEVVPFITDQLVGSFAALQSRSIVEGMVVTDSLGAQVIKVRNAADALLITDQLQSILSRVRSISDSLAFSDSLVATLMRRRALNEIISMIDVNVGAFIGNAANYQDVRIKIGCSLDGLAVLSSDTLGLPFIGATFSNMPSIGSYH